MELHLPPIRKGRNIYTGRFAKGYVPFNKGKKWDEYLPKETQIKILKTALNNLKGDPNIGGINAKEILGTNIKTKQTFYFKSAADAKRKTGIDDANIRSCCKNRRKTAGGFTWENLHK